MAKRPRKGKPVEGDVHIKWFVAILGRTGARYEDVLTIPREEWDGLTEEQREELVRTAAYEYIDMGYDVDEVE